MNWFKFGLQYNLDSLKLFFSKKYRVRETIELQFFVQYSWFPGIWIDAPTRHDYYMSYEDAVYALEAYKKMHY